jgi:hypothetical protein
MATTLDVLNTTLALIHDETSMTLQRATPFLGQIKDLGKTYKFNGGYNIRIPVEVQTPGNITSLDGTGYETLDMTARDSTQGAIYSWSRLAMPISISGRDKAENMGDAEIISLADVRYKSALASMMRAINKQVVVGGVSGLSALGTFNGTSFTNGVATGFFQNAAAAAQTNTIGGLSRGAGSVPGLVNQFAAVAGSAFGTTTAGAGFDALRAVRTAASLNRNGLSEKLFHLVLASQDAYNNYEAALVNQVRFMSQKELDSGTPSLVWNDALMFADPDISTYNASQAAADTISFYCLNLDDITLGIHDEGDFVLTPFVEVPNQDVAVAKLIFQGGLVAKRLGGSGLITGGDAT